tara:strand:+ start:4297 stop:5184 length:888 start_codon:yes stop_codon:yes gene_type:complete
MIKLLWNTHNQNQLNLENRTNKDIVDQTWGDYHKNSSDKWIFNILKKIEFKKIENQNNLDSGDILLVVDSSVEKKQELYSKLKLICSKMFLIHLGDESGSYDLTNIYNNFDFVWRTFCLNKFFNNPQVNCIPIGYKSGVFLKKQNEERKYKWTFIGTPHRSSRHDLLFQFSEIEPSYCYKTSKFNEKIIETNTMTEILSSTEFIPCPNGFFHPETYRVYEALECECIPIVENAFKYYDRLFPDNPFIKVDKWIDAKPIIQGWNKEKINKKREECKLWWINYQNLLQDQIYKKISK